MKDYYIKYISNIHIPRCEAVGRYIVETGDTVRGAARVFGISKSTVHKDITERLVHINAPLAALAREVLDSNKAQRHMRGGLATRDKYLSLKRVERNDAEKL